MSLPFSLPELSPPSSAWGPPTALPENMIFKDVPYAPYSKADKLGKMADWSQDSSSHHHQQRNRQNQRGQRDPYAAYGAGAASSFQYTNTEDESNFSVVDNTRTSTRPKQAFGAGGRGSGGGLVLRSRGGRGDSRGGRGDSRGGRGGGFTRYGGGRGDSRGGARGGRGGRRGGWKDYDKPQRLRDSSVEISPDWAMLEEIDFTRLAKLSVDVQTCEDIDSYGFTYYYDKGFDRAGGIQERRLQVIDTLLYNPTTSDDPVIQQLASNDQARVFATDSILSMIMCAPRSVYPWDIVVVREGDKLFFDKREGGPLDYVTVNENAIDPPLELADGSKDVINTPSSLSLEATFINQNFAAQAVVESESKHEFAHPNPFYNPEEETEPLASRGYRYRKFDLSIVGEETPLDVIVRTEVDGAVKNSSGEDSFITIKALNEFDSRAQGAGGALDWRSKFASQRGAVVATEMKNNSCKLARWTVQSILAGADQMKLGFVSRANPKDKANHVVLGVVGYKPREFAGQMNFNLSNGWGIARSIIDMCLRLSDGKYVLVKDPNKPVLRLYSVPADAFEETVLSEKEPEPESEA
ncbi:eukaryotic translation initiation factor 3 subunit D [Dipodascopsis tothii]|uniref:eukaryotic translation initiation factor 3 subunit D n=1 Tax=Dipodascopsis tothii TaxID=44089 RepID=UPI0034CE5383